MADHAQIHASKQPKRPHFLPEWAEKRGFRQADLARELNADKSLISRWFSGATPSETWQARLAALFQCKPEGDYPFEAS